MVKAQVDYHRNFPFYLGNLTAHRSVDPVLLAEASPNPTCFHRMLLSYSPPSSLDVIFEQ
jgi:hypothetical protein